MRVSWPPDPRLSVRDITPSGDAAIRRGTKIASVLPAQFLQSSRVSVERIFEISSTKNKVTRRETVLPVIALDVEGERDQAALVVLRHQSGAITFHPADSLERRGTGSNLQLVFQFRIPVRQTEAEGGRRGLVTQAVKAAILKVAKPITDETVSYILPRLAQLWEEKAWKKHRLSEGWFRVVQQSGSGLNLVPEVPQSNERNLLFLHGTFSNAVSAFGSLQRTDFFKRIVDRYADRIYAFNHFTVSRSPEDNVRLLLEALHPQNPQKVDVVTHSRGGLVVRTIVEGSSMFQDLAQRLEVGRVVLVASPNDGTPLATPERWDKTVGWFANLLEIIDELGPDNPFTTCAEFVSEAIVWLAHHLAGDLPGLGAMDAAGETISELQAPPAPPAHAYSALVANYNPDDKLWKRIVDVGVDRFFGGANDLVVPSEGGWRLDRQGEQNVDGPQIGCYGRGGNVAAGEQSAVMHTNFFSRQETATFIANALLGLPQNLPEINPNAPLPDRRFSRSAKVQVESSSSNERPQKTTESKALPLLSAPGLLEAGDGEVFYLAILAQDPQRHTAMLLATFRNARAMETLRTKGGIAGQKWRQIIDIQRRIRGYVNGDPRIQELPHGPELVELGTLLFQAMFPRQIRRLYDVARAAQPDGRINLIFTSMVDWIADLPWEFVYDPNRRNFLATSEVNFTRNVVTAVPADRMLGKREALRILVAVAQPLGLAHLSVDEEITVIKSGFRHLIDSGLAEVDVLVDATPSLLHQALDASSYDILHFIGHGEYDSKTKTGFLVFENDQGGIHKIDAQVVQQIMCRRNIRLVFLNACETGEGGSTDFNSGVAPALVAGGIPAVVGNQFSVLDISATAFARYFYWALAQGRSLGEAAREARIAVNYSISGEAIDWAVPVLFARNPADRLSNRQRSPSMPLMPQTKTRSVRGAFNDRVRVALWDVQKIVSSIDAIAQTLTNAQTRYAFEAVSFSAPIGTWRRQQTEDIAYINGQRVVERLRDKPNELGVDRLIAFTNFPLRDDRTRGIYSWDDDPKKQISIFSFYFLLDQITSTYTMERMIANAVASFVGALPAHKKGVKTCPFYYNDKVDIRYIAGALRLCGPDTRKLMKRDKDRLHAVKALLAAYG
jgi:pimeloyl-ACP methyl ester carboxylesterase